MVLTDEEVTHDLEVAMQAAIFYQRVKDRTLPGEKAMDVYDSWHKVWKPKLAAYRENSVLAREILDNFESELERNYRGLF